MIRIHHVPASVVATLVVSDDPVTAGDLYPVHIGVHRDLVIGKGRWHRVAVASKETRQESDAFAGRVRQQGHDRGGKGSS